MITDNAKDRAKLLAFWEQDGTPAVKDTCGVSRATRCNTSVVICRLAASIEMSCPARYGRGLHPSPPESMTPQSLITMSAKELSHMPLFEQLQKHHPWRRYAPADISIECIRGHYYRVVTCAVSNH